MMVVVDASIALNDCTEIDRADTTDLTPAVPDRWPDLLPELVRPAPNGDGERRPCRKAGICHLIQSRRPAPGVRRWEINGPHSLKLDGHPPPCDNSAPGVVPAPRKGF